MYWYRQYHGGSIELIVHTNAFGSSDFGKFNQSKFSAIKTVAESGSFTVNDVDYKDRAVYYCAVSEHSVITTGAEVYKNTHTRMCVYQDEIKIPTGGSMTQKI